MNFFRKKNRLLILAILTGFIIMVSVELPLLNSALKGKEKDFNDKLFYVVASLGEMIVKDSVLMGAINSNEAMIHMLQTNIAYKIDSVFIKNDIPTNYVLAAGKVQSEQVTIAEMGTLKQGFTQNNLIWSSDSANNKNIIETKVRIGYLGSPGNRIYYAKIYFPHKQQFLLWSLLPELVTVGFTLVILFICFLLLLSVIRKQHEVARSRDDFISNMTHELKTPLFTISIAARMLEEQDLIKSNERYISYLKTIREETARLLNLADKVMETSEIENKEATHPKAAADVHGMLSKAASRLELVKLERRSSITMKLEAAAHYVTGNQKNLENVFVNIIDNALKYSGYESLVSIITKNEGPDIHISIADNGIGFDPAIKELIFERFFRAHTGNVHDVKGYGIGLSFAKAVIDDHKGRVTVKTVPGKGSEFTIILPSIVYTT